MKTTACWLLFFALGMSCQADTTREERWWAVEEGLAWELARSEQDLEGIAEDVERFLHDSRRESFSARVGHLTSRIEELRSGMVHLSAASPQNEVELAMVRLQQLAEEVSLLRGDLTLELGDRGVHSEDSQSP
ncbi:MAG: hypothetical protein DWQ01_19765 [Planctomycetota bacterium]|nr:MAG: hypothetical protein DWQ01_19765 [Planctomycetota bacterium]